MEPMDRREELWKLRRAEDPSRKPVKVTVSDPETGMVIEERIIANDYCIVTAGNRYVKSVRMMGRTHMIAVAVEIRPPSSASPEGAEK